MANPKSAASERPPYVLFPLLILCVLFLFWQHPPVMKSGLRIQVQQNKSGPANTGVSGKLFEGTKKRNYTGPTLLSAAGAVQPPAVSTGAGQPRNKWAVCTTIFKPSEAILGVAALEGWSVVVVGDEGAAPFTMSTPNTVYLDVQAQQQLAGKYQGLLNLLPWRHFGRKNIGYLYAVSQGAEMIWDFDDDNVLKPGRQPAVPTSSVFDIVRLAPSCEAFNPYPSMGGPSAADPKVPPSWPRGFPLDRIRTPCNHSLVPGNASQVAVVQSLADNDPDVDGIFRLTRGVPFNFDSRSTRTLVIPKGTLTPWNAQATLFMQPAFWSLLLPVTVHGRVSDIWRSYISQRLLWDVGYRVAFAPPMVNQFRSPHNYLADMQAEEALYYKSGQLVAFLRYWRGSAPTIAGRFEELMIELYERQYVEAEDIALTQQWLKALAAAGYVFPPVLQEPTGSAVQCPGCKAKPQLPPIAGSPRNLDLLLPTKSSGQVSNTSTLRIQADKINGLGTNLTWADLPSLDIVCKTYTGGMALELVPELLLSFLVFWPKDYGRLVLVLDNEVEQEHFGGALLEQLSPQIDVVYENLTVSESSLFLGKHYEKRLGYDRQMMMRMYADLYTSAEYIALLDSDAVFITTVTPSNLFAADGRPLIGAVYSVYSTDTALYHNHTAAALGLPYSYIDFMTRFPLVLKRQHFQTCRQHIQKTMQASSFAVAWRKLLDVGGGSEQTLLGNCVWHFHRDEYIWHIQVDPRNDPAKRPVPSWMKEHPEYVTPMQHLANHKLFSKGFPDLLTSKEMRQGYCLSAKSMNLDKPFCQAVKTDSFRALTHFQPDGRDFSAPFVSPAASEAYLTQQQARFIQASHAQLRKAPGPEVIINIPPPSG